MLRTHHCNQLRPTDIDKTITLSGWVNNRRDHGGIIFVDLRDANGITQIVLDPSINPEAHAAAEHVRAEWVLQATGKVRARGEGLDNPKLETGEQKREVTNPKTKAKGCRGRTESKVRGGNVARRYKRDGSLPF